MDPTRNFDEAVTARSARPDHAKRETSELCRERAADNLSESGAIMTANQRIRLEASAASWTVRANMLQRVENGIARKAADSAAAKAASEGVSSESSPL